MKWIIDNKDSLINGVIGNGIFWGILQFWSLKNKIPNIVNINFIKYLGFIMMYALPIGTIIFMIFDKSNEPTFKNIALFIVICVSLIFNILMRHIRTIYKMFGELISITSDNDNIHKKAINIIFAHIGKEERIK